MISRKNKTEELEVKEQPKKSDPFEFAVKVIVRIGDQLVEQDIEESFQICAFNNISLPAVLKVLNENTTLCARWDFLYNEAVEEYDNMKTRYEIWLSKKSTEYRRELEKATKGRVTDKMVEDMIKCDYEYEKMNIDLSAAKKNKQHIYTIANGLAKKGEKAVNIGSLLKWEGEKLGGKHVGSEKKQYGHIERNYDKKESEKFDINKNDGWPT